VKLRILGCGTSSGVPRIGGDWGQCDPAEPRNRRTRASILVTTATTTILVDSGPDMRQQLLDAGIASVDAVIWTHEHADHTHGIDDLRQLFHASGKPVPGFARRETLELLESRFGYVFAGRMGYPATATAHLLGERATVGNIDIACVDMPHGPILSAGLRFTAGGKSICYLTDFNEITPDMQTLIANCDLLVIDALRRKPHPTHPHLAMTLEAIANARPGRTLLTHMDQSMDYATLRAELPAGVEPGYDGQELVLA
jgi:phosphoribosyl 1,2-cyclic phosphate phosphodiesterase